MDKEMIESIRNQINEVIGLLTKEEKVAYNLFAIGDTVVAFNEIEGITKGQKYRVISKPKPAYIIIEDLYGNEIGMFRADRFVLDNKEV